jgi:hypothetical protein
MPDETERERLRRLLRALVEYTRRVGGYMSPEDQMMLVECEEETNR